MAITFNTPAFSPTSGTSDTQITINILNSNGSWIGNEVNASPQVGGYNIQAGYTVNYSGQINTATIVGYISPYTPAYASQPVQVFTSVNSLNSGDIGVYFSVIAPSVSSVSPSSVVAGQDITVTGSNFTGNPSSNSLSATYWGNTGSIVSVNSSTSISARITGVDTAESNSSTGFNINSTHGALGAGYTITWLAPSVSGCSVTSWAVGATPSMTITGSNLLGQNGYSQFAGGDTGAVYFKNSSTLTRYLANSQNIANSSTITVTAPNNMPAGTYTIELYKATYSWATGGPTITVNAAANGNFFAFF